MLGGTTFVRRLCIWLSSQWCKGCSHHHADCFILDNSRGDIASFVAIIGDFVSPYSHASGSMLIWSELFDFYCGMTSFMRKRKMLISDRDDELDELFVVRMVGCLFYELIINQIVKMPRVAEHADFLIIGKHLMGDGLDAFTSFVESNLWEMGRL